MAISRVVLALTACTAVVASPVSKVVELLTGLEEKVNSEGAASEKAFEEFTAMCKDRTKELNFEIKTGTSESEELTAVIAEEVATMQAMTAKIDELSASIATSEAELKKATSMRETEAADFASAEKELMETIDTIERASMIIEREMSKGASLAQLSGAQGLAGALEVVVQASGVNSDDRAKLAALIQSQDGEEGVGAPDAAVYDSHSEGIFDALDNLKGKAAEELSDARQKEAEALHAFELKKQGLEDSIKFETKDLDAAKKTSAAASEKKAVSEGDLEATSKDLAADKESLEALKHDCMAKAEAFEEEKTSREAELKALSEAKKAVTEATSGAEKLTYDLAQTGTPDFLQVSSKSEGNMRAVHIVRRLAFAQHSAALAQLASRLEYAARSSEDPFGKVKSLIGNMLEKLEAEAGADATQKAFCDKEISESTAKKEEDTAEFDKLSTKLEQSTAASAKLKEEVAELQKELAALAKTQAEMDKLRATEKSTFAANKPEMEQGIEGVKLALKILRDYYAADAAHETTGDAGSGIISLLEVCESDFSKLLASMIAEEESAAAQYEEQTKENDITKAAKTQDVTYKTKEAAALEKAATELKSDIAGVQDQLDAVDKYLAELEKQCVAKAETYEERVERRNAEIAGLKAALEVLSSEEEETAFVQRTEHHVRRSAALRGSGVLRAA